MTAPTLAHPDPVAALVSVAAVVSGYRPSVSGWTELADRDQSR